MDDQPAGSVLSTSVRLAAMTDTKLVTALLIAAKGTVDVQSHLFHESAQPILQQLVAEASTGQLPRGEWAKAISERLNGLSIADSADVNMANLINQLQLAVPLGAHQQRVEAVLDRVLTYESGTVRTASLLQLLRGAMHTSSTDLQQRLLAALEAVACSPLGLVGLVQSPLLGELGIGNKPDTHDRMLFLRAATLARRGDQRGSKHGCLIVEDSATGQTDGGSSARDSVIIGEGWNHEVLEMRGRSSRKRVLHAEAHAIADAIQRLGERRAFETFGQCTAWIVELRDEAAYDDAPPCRKCRLLLQAIGVPRAAHSTVDGRLCRIQLPSIRSELLREPMACRPLMFACDALGVECERLEAALPAGDRRDRDGVCGHRQSR